MPSAARLADATAHGSPLNPGPGSPTVLIGFMPAGVGAAVDSLSNAMNCFMTNPMMTPADAAPSLAQIGSAVGQVAGQASAAGSPGTAGAASSSMTALMTTNATLTATWTTASTAPGGQPAASKAYTEAIKAAAAGAAALMSSMAALSDMHVCRLPVPIPPHGPGFVTKGSSKVIINNLAAARQGDKVMEACGGADPIAMGCPQVIIG